MRRFSPRLLLALPCLAALIAVLAGCETPQLDTQTARQQDLIGPVRVTTPIEGCNNSNPTDNTNCSGASPLQLLVGYRVPAGTTAPASVASSAGLPTTFHLSSTFASELQRLVPAPSGQQWIGYLSDELTPPDTTSGPNTVTLAPDFNPPAAPAGGNFTYRTLVGMRDDSVVTDPTRAVQCGISDLAATGSNGDTCLTSGSMADLTGGDISVPLNDLTLSPGAGPSVNPGDTATVPFVATLSGPALPGGSSFTLSAISGLPGAAAAPGAASLATAPGANAASATVKVPVTASPGDYPVTLTATSGGQTRQATGSVHVNALPPINVAINRSLSVKNGVASLSLTCPSSNVDPCAGSVTLNTAGKVLLAKKHKPKARKRALKLGSSSFSIAPGQTGVIKVKISSAGQKALARTGKLRANATFLLTNRAGQAAKNVSHVTLVQAKARKKHHKK